jgi:hypothetical protein
MTTLLHLEVPTAQGEARKAPKRCVTPGCPHLVTESLEESGLLCDECAIEGELYDRDARWDHVCPIPGTHCLPCQAREESQRQDADYKARHPVKMKA